MGVKVSSNTPRLITVLPVTEFVKTSLTRWRTRIFYLEAFGPATAQTERRNIRWIRVATLRMVPSSDASTPFVLPVPTLTEALITRRFGDLGTDIDARPDVMAGPVHVRSDSVLRPQGFWSHEELTQNEAPVGDSKAKPGVWRLPGLSHPFGDGPVS